MSIFPLGLVDLLLVLEMTIRGLKEEQLFRYNRLVVIGWQRTLYQLIMDVLVEHLNPLDLNPPWDLISFLLVLKRNPCCLIFFALLF
jgi:hypothetical protein